MDTIREYFNKPVVVGVAGLILGIIIGLIYGWVINPVQYTDAAARNLRPDLQEDWLRMAIDSYANTGDVAAAQLAWSELQPDADATMAITLFDDAFAAFERGNAAISSRLGLHTRPQQSLDRAVIDRSIGVQANASPGHDCFDGIHAVLRTWALDLKGRAWDSVFPDIDDLHRIAI